MQNVYQLDYQHSPWQTFRYQIKHNDVLLYQVRRSGFHKYRQFEDIQGEILYHIGLRTIQSVDHEQLLAKLHEDGKTIETIFGHFTLTDLDLSQRSYSLKFNGNLIAQVKRKSTIEIMKNSNQTFLFALLILIDTILQTAQSPLMYTHAMHAPQVLFKNFVAIIT